MSDHVIQSYVTHDEGCEFFVSTIARNSSAAAAPDHRYHETLVWRWDRATREQGAMLHNSSDALGSLHEHFKVCAALHHLGRPPES